MGVAIESLRRAHDINFALTRFVEYCFVNQISIHYPRRAILAWQRRQPMLRGRLKTAWSALRGWEITLPWRSRTPVPLAMAQRIFLQGLEDALAARSRKLKLQYLCLAFLWMLSFWGLLRPGEALSLTTADITVVMAGLESLTAVVGIMKPKTRRVPTAGRHQVVAIVDAGTSAWAQYICSSFPRGTPLWPWTRARHYEMFRSVLHRCSLKGVGITPASARAGGATHLYLTGLSLEHLAFLGRWVSVSSMRAYIQEGGYQLAWTQISAQDQKVLHNVVGACSSVLSSPPKASLDQWLFS